MPISRNSFSCGENALITQLTITADGTLCIAQEINTVQLNERTPTSSLNSNSESKVITFTGNDLSTFLRRKGVILNIESVTRLLENQSDHSVTLYLHVYGCGMNQNYTFFLFSVACINTQDLYLLKLVCKPCTNWLRVDSTTRLHWNDAVWHLNKIKNQNNCN